MTKTNTLYNRIFDEETIQTGVKKCVEEIIRLQVAYQHPYGDRICLCPIMTGSFLFGVDLARELIAKVPSYRLRIIPLPGNPKDLRAKDTTYLKLQQQASEGAWHVVLIDTFADTGATFLKWRKRFNRSFTTRPTLMSLLHRPKAKEQVPLYAPLTYTGEEWLGGYGLDIAQDQRITSRIFSVPKEIGDKEREAKTQTKIRVKTKTKTKTKT